MMAVIVAALMSDLDSIFNSASSLFTIDIWRRIRRKCSVREQMIVGRCACADIVVYPLRIHAARKRPVDQVLFGGQTRIQHRSVLH